MICFDFSCRQQGMKWVPLVITHIAGPALQLNIKKKKSAAPTLYWKPSTDSSHHLQTYLGLICDPVSGYYSGTRHQHLHSFIETTKLSSRQQVIWSCSPSIKPWYESLNQSLGERYQAQAGWKSLLIIGLNYKLDLRIWIEELPPTLTSHPYHLGLKIWARVSLQRDANQCYVSLPRYTASCHTVADTVHQIPSVVLKGTGNNSVPAYCGWTWPAARPRRVGWRRKLKGADTDGLR